MNELSSSADSRASSRAQAGAPEPAGAKSAGMGSPGNLRGAYIAIAVLALLQAGQWWSSHSQLTGLREEVAQRLKNSDAIDTETRVLAKSVQESVKELQGKVSVLEGKQQEAQSQQLALDQLYQDLSKNRDDWALAEIEQVLSTASQQLQLAANVQGAVIALQNADSRLSTSDRPQFVNIRRAIARDLDRLRSLPNVDITGIALRMDNIAAQIDSMPLLADEQPAPPPPKTVQRSDGARGTAGAKGSAAREWLAVLGDRWNKWTGELWAEFRQLLEIRNVESPEALLLSPSEAFYTRENLKLRLLNARLALMSRNESAFRADLKAVQDGIAKYFDTRARQTQAVLAQLRQVQASNLSIEMPNLSESLNAVRNYKAKP